MADKLASERIIIEEPTSFSGSAKRIWRMTEVENVGVKLALIPVALMFIMIAWSLVAMWYMMFGIFLIPWRLISRGSRKRKLETLRHQEMMQASKQ